MDNKKKIVVVDVQHDFSAPNPQLQACGEEEFLLSMAELYEKLERDGSLVTIDKGNNPLTESYSIADPKFWSTEDGNTPSPFTVITQDDVLTGVWKPRDSKEKLIKCLTLFDRIV